jgi:hypothetical protein
MAVFSYSKAYPSLTYAQRMYLIARLTLHKYQHGTPHLTLV